MRFIFFLKMFGLFGSVLASTTFSHAAALPDTLPPHRISVSENFAKSWVLPAWGSYESESYLLCTIQSFVDFFAVTAMVGFIVDPPNPDAGVGLIPIIISGVFLGNRLIGAPINAAMASSYDRSRDPPRNMRLAATRVHGRIAVTAGGYASTGEMAMGAEWQRAGFKLTWAWMEGNFDEYTWFDSTSVIHNENYSVMGMYGFETYYRFAVNSFLDVQPGLRCNFEKYQYGGHVSDYSSQTLTHSPIREKPFSLSIIPHASIVAHPFRRIEVELGIGYVVLKPSHVKAFESQAHIRSPQLGGRSPWRLNGELAIAVW